MLKIAQTPAQATNILPVAVIVAAAPTATLAGLHGDEALNLFQFLPEVAYPLRQAT
jgi:hypothetical protein